MEQQVKKEDPSIAFELNGVSLHSLTVDQEGNLEVEFELPCERTSAHWETDTRASRTFDIYEDKELQDACRHLFKLVRKRVMKPDPERLRVHCDSCATADCCRKYNVLLRESDIERLARGLGITPARLRQRHTVPAVDWSGDHARQLAADRDENGDEKCVFLKQAADGSWRCSVYEHRPEICRNFDMRTCDDFVALEEVEEEVEMAEG
jgi:Fe-S-cluster containining protein